MNTKPQYNIFGNKYQNEKRKKTTQKAAITKINNKCVLCIAIKKKGKKTHKKWNELEMYSKYPLSFRKSQHTKNKNENNITTKEW